MFPPSRLPREVTQSNRIDIFLIREDDQEQRSVGQGELDCYKPSVLGFFLSAGPSS